MRELTPNKLEVLPISRKRLETPFHLSEVEVLWRIFGFAVQKETMNGTHLTPCSKLLFSAMHFILFVVKNRRWDIWQGQSPP